MSDQRDAATQSRIVRSRIPDVEIPDLSLTDYTFRTAPADADRIAIVDGLDGSVWTRGALLDRIRRLAGGLFERGISRGSTVALIAGNSPDFAAVFHAVTLTGATVTPINPTYGPGEIAHQLDDARVDLLIVGASAAPAAAASAGERPVFVLGDPGFDQLLGEPIDQQPCDLDSASPRCPTRRARPGFPKA